MKITMEMPEQLVPISFTSLHLSLAFPIPLPRPLGSVSYDIKSSVLSCNTDPKDKAEEI